MLIDALPDWVVRQHRSELTLIACFTDMLRHSKGMIVTAGMRRKNVRQTL